MVSPQSAELALDCMAAVYRIRKAESRDGRPLLDERWRRAIGELKLAAFAGESAARDRGEESSSFEEVDVATAAQRLSVSPQTVRARCASGALPARRIGRQWLIEWQQKENAA